MSLNQIHNSFQQTSRIQINDPNVQAVVVNQIIKITPVGVAVRIDCNPIAKYNHSIDNYNNRCNIIQGIQLNQIWCCCLVSWIYDLVIYFYTMFFNTITYQNNNDHGLIITLVLLTIYVLLLIMPVISVITFVISAIFFLYYIVGLIFYCNNVSRLGNHQFTQNMIQAYKSPPFQTQNQYFQISNEETIRYYQKNNMWNYYQEIVNTKKTRFMAYKPIFLSDNYYYIKSAKMIGFHIAFMLFAIIGLVISVSAFPSAYGK